MKERKRLIEARLPLAEIDEEASHEKAVGGTPPLSRLLFWWTRKPLVVSRAAVLASILPRNYSMKSFRAQLGIGRDHRAFNYSVNTSELRKFLPKPSGERLKLLDPMAGGGSMPFEALRCGIDSVAFEYNPVAYILLKATLEYPKRYGLEMAEDVEVWGKEVLRRAKEEIGYLYPKHGARQPSHYISCWVSECPRCHQKNPLVSQWWLVRKSKKRLGLKPILEKRDFNVDFTKNPPEGTVSRGKSTCLNCGAPLTNEHIRREISSGKSRLLCVVIPHKGGKVYEKPFLDDFKALEGAQNLLEARQKEFEKLGLIPIEEMPNYELDRVVPYGFDRWYKLFSARQLLCMLSISKHITEIASEIESQKGREYAKIVATYLTLVLCQHARYNSFSTTWNRTRETIASVFSLRRPGMMWDHTEVNPFSTGSGTWETCLSSVVSAIKFASESLKRSGQVRVDLCSALNLPSPKSKFDVIVTDPPYLDDVPYGELSEFYHVWLWRILHAYYPELPGPKVPVDEELDHSPGRHGSAKLSREFYMNGLTESFRQMRKVLADDGLLVLFFAHSKRQAWSIMISSLINSGFRVTMTWPVRTESPTSVVQRGRASMQSSILVAVRKRIDGGTAFLEDLRDEIAIHVRKGLEAIIDLNFIGADLIVAGMGKALEVTTRYSELKSYSGNATLESMLEVVSEVVFSYSIEKLVRRPLAALDPETAFYIFVKCSYGGVIPPDDALMICKGAGVELQALQHDKIIGKKKIGPRTILTTLNAYERDLDIEKPPHTPTILDQLHLLELAVQKHGKKGFDRLLSSQSFRAGDVRAVAEGLYNGLLLTKKNDPEIELLRPIIDLFKTGVPKPPQKTIDKYLTENE